MMLPHARYGLADFNQPQLWPNPGPHGVHKYTRLDLYQALGYSGMGLPPG